MDSCGPVMSKGIPSRRYGGKESRNHLLHQMMRVLPDESEVEAGVRLIGKMAQIMPTSGPSLVVRGNQEVPIPMPKAENTCLMSLGMKPRWSSS